MALNESDIEKLRAHLAKFPDQQNCPVCNSNTWAVGGPWLFTVVSEAHPLKPSPSSTPVVGLICETCCHIRHFAWMPIRLGIDPVKGGTRV